MKKLRVPLRLEYEKTTKLEGVYVVSKALRSPFKTKVYVGRISLVCNSILVILSPERGLNERDI